MQNLNTCSIIHQFGKLEDVIEIETNDLPNCGPDDVLIKMEYAPINPSDIITISGAYRGRTQLPFHPGFEGVGLVYQKGKNILHLNIGERVMPIRQSGTWQKFQLAKAQNCFKMNGNLSPQDAAMSYINPMTALKMVDEIAKVDHSMQVLVNAANSEIGHIIIELCLKLGAKVTTLARSKRSITELNKVFGDKISVQNEDAFIKSNTDQSFDVMFDAIGGPKAEGLAASLKIGGMIVHYGLLSGVPISPKLHQQRPDIALNLYWLRNWVHSAPYEDIQQMFDKTAELILNGTIATRVYKTLALDEIKTAAIVLEDPNRSGKVLLAL
ncbi:MAG: zinc-dependent alcohol dehydrogenase family protein [Lentilitoribacter sp.]